MEPDAAVGVERCGIAPAPPKKRHASCVWFSLLVQIWSRETTNRGNRWLAISPSASRKSISWSTRRPNRSRAACRRRSSRPRAWRPAAGSRANFCSHKSRSFPRRIPAWPRPAGSFASAADIGHRRRRPRPRLSGRRHAPHRDVGRFAADPERTLRRRDARSADDRAAQHAVRDACACRTARSRCARRPMYRMLPYLPLFLALSTSSPFWQSRRTGLRATDLPPMTSCRAPACRSCSAPRRN